MEGSSSYDQMSGKPHCALPLQRVRAGDGMQVGIGASPLVTLGHLFLADINICLTVVGG